MEFGGSQFRLFLCVFSFLHKNSEIKKVFNYHRNVFTDVTAVVHTLVKLHQ